jgi:hypothetical protein
VHDQQAPRTALLRAIRRSFVSIRRVIEVPSPPQASVRAGRDLPDRGSLGLTVVLCPRDRPAPLGDSIDPSQRGTWHSGPTLVRRLGVSVEPTAMIAPLPASVPPMRVSEPVVGRCADFSGPGRSPGRRGDREDRPDPTAAFVAQHRRGHLSAGAIDEHRNHAKAAASRRIRSRSKGKSAEPA